METQKTIESSGAVTGPPDDATPLRLLNAAQAAEALNISQRQVYDEVREGRLNVIRIGTRVLFRPADIITYVEARATHSKR